MQSLQGCKLQLQVEPFLDNLVSPVAVVSSRAAPHELYIAEQRGIVWKYNALSNQKSKFLDITTWLTPLESDYDERGLLGLCLHPEFGQYGSPHVNSYYIFYSTRNPNYEVALGYSDDPIKPDPKRKKKKQSEVYYNCVSAFHRLLPGGETDTKSEIILMSIQKKEAIHNGGKIAFGPLDGLLYVATGDGGPQEDPSGKAQSLETWHGKILCIDVSRSEQRQKNTLQYDVPLDNPFVNTPGARPEIYAYGFRNPWGMCWDSRGRLVVSDVGYNSREEVDIVVKGGNYGWNLMEGSLRTAWTRNKPLPRNLVSPVFEYATPDPTGAIIGGYCVRVANQDELYVFGDLSGKIAAIRLPVSDDGHATVAIAPKRVDDDEQTEKSKTNPKKRQRIEMEKSVYVKSFGKGGDGVLYVLTSKRIGPTGKTGEVSIVRIHSAASLFC